jgi:hypothetical protein
MGFSTKFLYGIALVMPDEARGVDFEAFTLTSQTPRLAKVSLSQRFLSLNLKKL